MGQMRKRKRARRLGFQALFMMDARDEWNVGLANEFLRRTEPPPDDEALAYAVRLLETVLEHREPIDRWLDAVHPHWRLHRLRGEDRNILRLGLAELWFHDDVPPKVVINEWVEVAKHFSGDEAPAFVNGLLDRAWKDNPDREHPDRQTPVAG